MKSYEWIRGAGLIALVSLATGCATWKEMDRSEKGTAVGATGGAVVGAAVGGPVGAAVGAGVGGYAGHHQGLGSPSRSDMKYPSSVTRTDGTYNEPLVRSVQQSLNQKGFDAGAADGQWGPNTERALMQFQQANGLTQTGDLDARTLSVLGVSR